jgi:hypothetical protein
MAAAALLQGLIAELAEPPITGLDPNRRERVATRVNEALPKEPFFVGVHKVNLHKGETRQIFHYYFVLSAGAKVDASFQVKTASNRVRGSQPGRARCTYT